MGDGMLVDHETPASRLPEAQRFALDFTSSDRLMFVSDRPWVVASRMFETRGFLYERLFIAGNRRPAVPLVAHPSRCRIEMYSNIMRSASWVEEIIFFAP
jgi:hypothetical protein